MRRVAKSGLKPWAVLLKNFALCIGDINVVRVVVKNPGKKLQGFCPLPGFEMCVSGVGKSAGIFGSHFRDAVEYSGGVIGSIPAQKPSSQFTEGFRVAGLSGDPWIKHGPGRFKLTCLGQGLSQVRQDFGVVGIPMFQVAIEP